MKLYKFRSLYDESREYTLDILANERLYCAPHSDLNDPFEGLFEVIEWSGGVSRSPMRPVSFSPARCPVRGSSSKNPRKLSDVPGMNDGCRVCSLSAGSSDIRMWSHYAAGHTGVAIELDLEVVGEIKKVKYLHSLNSIDQSVASILTAEDVLSWKTHHWEYEQEFRILQNEPHYCVKGRISAVLLGVRFNRNANLELLKQSLPDGVPIYESRLDYGRIQVLRGNPL